MPLTLERASDLLALMNKAVELANANPSFKALVYAESELRLLPALSNKNLPPSILQAAHEVAKCGDLCHVVLDAGAAGMKWLPPPLKHAQLIVQCERLMPEALWQIDVGQPRELETFIFTRSDLLAYLCRVVPAREVRGLWRGLALDDEPAALEVAEEGRLYGESTGRPAAPRLRPEDLLPLLRSEIPEVREGVELLLGRTRRRPRRKP